MITVHAGKLGAGKSYSATAEVWKMIHQGKTCFVNWQVDFTDYFIMKRKSWWYRLWNPIKNLGKVYHFEGLQDLNKLRNGEAFYDEAHMDIDARNFQTLDAEFKRKLTQSRKYGLNLHFISQHSQQIDIAVRRLANCYVLHSKVWRFFFWREWDGEAIEILANPLQPRPKSQGYGFYWFSKRFAKSYDTFALFKPFPNVHREPMWDGQKIVLDQRKAQEKARQVITVEPTAPVPLENLNQKGGD